MALPYYILIFIIACLNGLSGLPCAFARAARARLDIARKDSISLLSSNWPTRKLAKNLTLPEPTSYGFLDVNSERGSAMFYMYYEAREINSYDEDTPIVLWLQVRALEGRYTSAEVNDCSNGTELEMQS